MNRIGAESLFTLQLHTEAMQKRYNQEKQKPKKRINMLFKLCCVYHSLLHCCDVTWHEYDSKYMTLFRP
jgi:hypothetical protein